MHSWASHEGGVRRETWEVIQCYLVASVLLIVVQAGLAFNAVAWHTMARVLLTCGVLVGLYALLVRVFRNAGVAALVMIVLLACLPLVPVLRYPLYLLGALGGAVLFRHGWLPRGASLYALPLLLVVILGSGIYIDFQYESQLAAGALNVDSFFHAAIAAMYGRYGVASLGLDGLVPIAYHTLSHRMLAGVSALGGLEALETYAYVFIGMGPALLAFSLAGLACRLDRQLPFGRALLVIVLLFLASIAVPVFGISALWDSYLVSESYLVALVLLAASLATFLPYIEANGTKGSGFQLITAILLLICAGLTKGSVGLLGLCVFGWVGLVRMRRAGYWIVFLLASALMYVLVVAAVNSAEKLVFIKPFDFVETFVNGALFTDVQSKLGFFVAVHFLPVWLCFAAGGFRQGLVYVKTFEFQVLFALLVPAFALSMAFHMPGGAAYYFSSVPVIVALPFLAARLGATDGRSKAGWFIFLAALGLAFSGLFHQLGWIGADPVALALAAVLPLILVGFLPLTSRQAGWLYIALLVCVSTFALQDRIVKRTFLASAEGAPVDISDTVRLLDHIRTGAPDSVYVRVENPQDLVAKIGCKAYWLLPAVMERPLVNGLPDLGLCPSFKGIYGLSDYRKAFTVPPGATVLNLRIGGDLPAHPVP